MRCFDHDHVKHLSPPCVHTSLTHCVHAIGAPEIGASFELEGRNPKGPEVTQEMEAQPAGPEEPEEEIECPSHEPTSFVKGKPRSILCLPCYFPEHV